MVRAHPGLAIAATAGVRHRHARRHRATTRSPITDTGQTPYAGITVTDDLAGLLDDATYNGDATAGPAPSPTPAPT